MLTLKNQWTISNKDVLEFSLFDDCCMNVSKNRRSTNHATTRRCISHRSFKVVYMYTMQGSIYHGVHSYNKWMRPKPNVIFAWIRNRVECRSWWTTHSLHYNLEQPYNIQMHFIQLVKQQKSTTKGPLDLIKMIHAKGLGKSWGFDYAHKMSI